MPDASDAAAHLEDSSTAVSPAELLAARDPRLKAAGLYSWRVDEVGAELLSQGLGHIVGAGLIYVGQAGATRWPSGTRSGNTLWKRIGRNHLGKDATKSVLRRTLGSIRVTALSTQQVDEAELTDWMHEHLKVATFPTEDRDGLKELESDVLTLLDPALNDDGVLPTPVRVEAKRLRTAFYGAAAR